MLIKGISVGGKYAVWFVKKKSSLKAIIQSFEK